jgi:AcrR family transcriptional regulator
VVQALEALLQEDVPYAEIGVERLAQRAGISRTAFYFYFRDKREVLDRLTASVATELLDAGGPWFTGDDTGADALGTALGRIAAVFSAHGPLLRAVVEVAAAEPRVGDEWRGLIGRFVAATARQIEAEQAAGRATASDPHATAFALVWGVERALFQQIARGADVSLDAVVDALHGIWLRAIYGRTDADA